MRGSTKQPTFLGIGVQKSGTTWLYHLLKSHVQIYMPEYRKELHFFDSHYSNGLEWYNSFFSDSKTMHQCKEAGEFTPSYIYNENALQRIKKDLPESKFIVIFRNPLDRLISSFKYYKQRGGENDFITFSNQDGVPFKKGLYSVQISRWFKHFNRDQFLILIFEEAVFNPEQTKKRIADFFNIDADLFSRSGHETLNKSFQVRFKKLYVSGVKTAKVLRKWHLDIAITHFKKIGLHSIFHSSKKIQFDIDEDQKRKLMEIYSEDIYNLERLMNYDFSLWHNNRGSGIRKWKQ